MEFTFSDEQEQLRDAVRALARAALRPSTHVRAMEDDPIGITDELWDELVDARVDRRCSCPRRTAAAALGLVDLVAGARGDGPRARSPGRSSRRRCSPRWPPRRLGLDDQLASLAAGATRGTIAVDELGHGDPVDRIRTRATPQGRPLAPHRH